MNPWTVAHQAPLSMGFSRQESWSGVPLPSPGNLPDEGIEPWLPGLQADFLLKSHQGSPVRRNGRHKRLSGKVDNKSNNLIYELK